MQTRRLTRAGLVIVAALTLAVAGCTPTNGDTAAPTNPPTSAAPQERAAEELTAAAQKLNDDTVTVNLESTGLATQGKLDPKANKATMTMNVTADGKPTKIDIVLVDKDVYLKVPGTSEISDKWMHIDVSKLAGTNFDIMPQGDPAGANNLVKGVADVQRDGDRGFKGTLDLTKAPVSDNVSIQALGDKAKAVPFTATTDEQGRLTGLTIDLSAVEPSLGTLKTTYTDFGAPVTVAQPAAGETVEAPDSLLKILGG